MDEKEVVRHINTYLAKSGRKQYELAAQIGAPVQTVNRWLTGKAKVSRAYQFMLKEKKIIP